MIYRNSTQVGGWFSDTLDVFGNLLGLRSNRTTSQSEVTAEQALTAKKEAAVKNAAMIGGVAVVGIIALTVFTKKR